MKALIISYGVAGRRHAKILSLMGFSIHIVTSQIDTPSDYICYPDIRSALCEVEYNYIVIASITSNHFSDLIKVLKYRNNTPVLVEKPIFSRPENVEKFKNMKNIYVGYNMRFLTHIKNLAEILKGQNIIKSFFYSSSHLPSWRKELNYKLSYSISKDRGGGVLRDLSHEIDLACLFLGDFENILCRMGHISKLAGDADDSCDILFSTNKCKHGIISLNNFSNITKRFFQIDTDENSYYYDILRDCLVINDTDKLIGHDMNYSYLKMHESILKNNGDFVCDMNQALKIINVINKAESVSELND